MNLYIGTYLLYYNIGFTINVQGSKVKVINDLWTI